MTIPLPNLNDEITRLATETVCPNSLTPGTPYEHSAIKNLAAFGRTVAQLIEQKHPKIKKQQYTMYINIYNENKFDNSDGVFSGGILYSTKEDAEYDADSDVIAKAVPVTFEA
jgi:hypothetical protein